MKNNYEYEYSYEVTSINEFIKYCEDNSYKKISENNEKRVLYKDKKGIMARITFEEELLNKNTKKYLDFKEDKISKESLNIRKETKKLNITETNKKFVNSLLEFLNLEFDKELIRKRYVYEKGNVKIELDDYSNPVMKVVAIEGNKIEVDKINDELKGIIESVRI